jgi:hypothetical protein
MELKPICELGVDEAYAILKDHFHLRELPPLLVLENEDWGRDYLLSLLFAFPASELALTGVCVDDRNTNRPMADGE